MAALLAIAGAAFLVAVVGFVLSLRIVQQYEEGVLFRLGRMVGVKHRPARRRDCEWADLRRARHAAGRAVRHVEMPALRK